MQVTINDFKHDYQPDFKANNKSWKVKLKDAFTIVDIGGTKCFVKRFTDKPSAMELLLKIKGQAVVNMPEVYDVVTNNENNKLVYYLFLECIEGKTLKESIQDGEAFNTKQIARDILDGLKFIHNQGFWFGDFNEENIFYTESGRYVLIDVDSCYPNPVRPAVDALVPGGMPGSAQEYANVVMLFYRQILDQKQFLFEQIEGKNLNCLQLLVLIAKLTCFLENKKDNSKTAYVNKKIYKDLHYFLLNRNELYCKTVFSKALNNTLQYPMVLELSKFIIGENVTLGNNLPVIEHFKASDYDIFNGNNTTLNWSVKNAADISLSTESSILLQKAAPVSSLSVKPARTETYSLTAVNNTGNKVVKTIQLNVIQLSKPEIKYFNASKLKIKKGETVSLSWSVEHASRLFVNGTEYDSIAANIFVSPIVSSTYIMVAENKSGEKISSQVNIQVASSGRQWWIIAGIVLLMILGIWQLILSSNYDDKIKQAGIAFNAGDYDGAVTDYKDADAIAKELIFSNKPSPYAEINAAHCAKDKKGGEDLLLKAVILAPPAKPDSIAAINSFREAQTFNTGDSTVSQRLTFCEKVSSARTYRLAEDWVNASRSYQDAIDFGTKTSVPKAAIDMVKQTLNYVLLPKIKLLDKSITYNVLLDGSTGLQINCRLKTAFLRNTSCKAVAYFYDNNGQKLYNSAAPASYLAADNQICMPNTIYPTEDEQTVSVTFFMPNDILLVNCGKFRIGIFKSDNTSIWLSDFYTYCSTN